MEQTEQSNRQRHLRIEHVFRAADEMAPTQQHPGEIDNEQGLK